MIKLDYRNRVVSEVKVIDFGSSFEFDDVNQNLELTTPEYLPPDVLEYLEFKQMHLGAQRNEQIKQQLNIQNRISQWSIDIWSLGVIILEMVTGFPIWMSYKGRIVCEWRDQTSQIMTGLFGVQGRMPSKIIKLQQQVASNLPKFFYNYS